MSVGRKAYRDGLLRGQLLAALVTACVAALLHAPWSVRAAQGVISMQCGRAPIWSPPHLPTTAVLANVFHVPESALLSGSYQVVQAPHWRSVLFDALGFAWVGVAIVLLLQWVRRRSEPDPWLPMLRWAWLGGSGGASLSLGLWWVGGGWGSPMLPGLAIGGALTGGIVAAWRARRQRTCSTATLR